VTSLVAPAAIEPAPPDEFLRDGAPSIAVEEVPVCPVCTAGQFHTFTTGFDYELRTCANAWRFVRCAACTHVWLNPRPALDALGVIYPPTYYAYNYETKIHPIALRGKAMLDRWKMSGIVRRLARAPRSYLDVGCGSGRFLKAMEQRGICRERLYGLELDERVVADLAAQGYQVRCQRVETCDSIPDASIDLITMFHVIEHVDDPAAVIRRLAAWLAPGGVLAIETPNIDSLDARLFHDRLWGGYHIPRQWNLFSASTLGGLLRDAALTVTDTLYQTGHSFWMYMNYHAAHHLWVSIPYYNLPQADRDARAAGRPHARVARQLCPLPLALSSSAAARRVSRPVSCAGVGARLTVLN